MYHIEYSIDEISQVLHAQAFIRDHHAVLHTIAFDSRKLTDQKHTLYFALQGRRDGHRFIGEAYAQGIRNFVISEHDLVAIYPEANFLLVKNTLDGLQQLTACHRLKFNYPVIAITGSNGKTIVKDWLYQLLSPEKNIVRSPKSYNSQLGVPLSVWEMREDHTLAIIEAGISKSGEMNRLQRVIRPSIGILTNIGEAHNEGFSSKQDKIAEKLTLFTDTDLFIYSPKYLKEFKGTLPGKRKFTWNWHENADLTITKGRISDDHRHYTLVALFRGQEIQCVIPFADAASIENAICCWATMLALNYSPEVARERLEKLHSVRMRLELKKGINNCSVIDDSYSLDVSSLSIALDFLHQQNQHQKRTLILSDVPETGIDAEALYREIAALLADKGVDRLIGVGKEISTQADKFTSETTFFPDTDTLLKKIDQLSFSDESILLKGARRFEFEKISKILVAKVHETVLEINLNALENNLNYYKSLLKPGVRITTMVKAFSYGSGSFEIANLLQFNKVDYLAVAFADEGVALREAGITLPIMVMNPDVMGFDTMIEHRLEPEIYNRRALRDFSSALQRKEQSHYPIHVKLDTGMHRSGFVSDEIDQLLPELLANHKVRVQSVFSHLTSSEDPEADDFTQSQIDLFTFLTQKIENALGYQVIKHIANTSAISRWPQAQFDMVRLGIGLYGVDSTFNAHNSPLQPVASLKTTISQIKALKAGETVGYNRKGVMLRDGKTATVKIGYADGYRRELGNGRGKMIVNGKMVPTIGNICMDVCMLDITDVDAREGDEVVVFNDYITVQDIAKELGTIPYEILTGISQRVKRVYFYE